jgi:hypothetical protein
MRLTLLLAETRFCLELSVSEQEVSNSDVVIQPQANHFPKTRRFLLRCLK